MSYNLLAEGDLDFVDMARLVAAHAPLELFPIPGEGPHGDSLGIALSGGNADAASVETLSRLIERLWAHNAVIWDLMAGQRVADANDLVELRIRILGH